MASVFGIPELRSRIHDWREILRKFDPGTYQAGDNSGGVDADIQERNARNLSVVIENLVIPKLIADVDNPRNRYGEQGLAETVGTARRRPISDADVAEFTRLSSEGEACGLLDFVDNCLATGSSVDGIFVDLLAPAARHLGILWEEDRLDFVDVTMALWRIQEVLRELTLRIPPAPVPGQGQRSALFSTMPGEQHSLGTLMISECFQREGWETQVLMEPTESELVGIFADRHYDLVGLTVTNDCPRAALSGLVNTIRSVSNNPGIRVMIGGRVIVEQPELVDFCGADGTAADARSAVKIADRLVPLEASLRAKPL